MCTTDRAQTYLEKLKAGDHSHAYVVYRECLRPSVGDLEETGHLGECRLLEESNFPNSLLKKAPLVPIRPRMDGKD